jgi:hypothetical protein
LILLLEDWGLVQLNQYNELTQNLLFLRSFFARGIIDLFMFLLASLLDEGEVLMYVRLQEVLHL